MKKQSLAEVARTVSEPEMPPESCEVTENGDECSLTYHGAEVKTVDQLIENSGIDLARWEIYEKCVKNWEIAGKRSMGQTQNKTWRADQLWKTGLRQITVKLRRRAPKLVQDGITDLMKGWKPWGKIEAPKKKPPADRHLLGIYLSDSHFGKRCWSPECGDNYDLPIADETYRKGFDDLLSKSMRFAPNVSEIWLPIGNDFFHVNDWQSRTVNETRVESTDDRFPKVFRVGVECILNTVRELSKIAPVKVIWIPGNHDFVTSWHLGVLLEYAFRDVKHITVDMGLRARKYFRFGCTLVGMCHGEKVKESKLPTLMSSEARHMIDAGVLFREWHLGHLHMARETQFCTEDSLPNTIIRRLPSLCGTDGWHDQQGFVDTYKMAESWLWSETEGPQAKFITHAKGDTVAV